MIILCCLFVFFVLVENVQRASASDNRTDLTITSNNEDELFQQCFTKLPSGHMTQTARWLKNEYIRNEAAFMRRVTQTMAVGTARDQVHKYNPVEMTTLHGGGTFILWGGKPGKTENYMRHHDPYDETPNIPKVTMSAFQENATTGFVEAVGSRGIQFINPTKDSTGRYDTSLENMNGVHVFEGNHVAFFIDMYEVFAHIMLDMIPFIAYIRETFPSDTKLLLPNSKHKLRSLIDQWDPQFAKERVSWIECPIGCGNELVNIVNGDLTVVHPQVETRHLDFLLALRHWIDEKASFDKDPNGYIVYYTRNSKSASHGRALDMTQEREILNLIEEEIKKHNRKEQLVVFDGENVTFQEQMHLFKNAKMVIGAHGGGLANLLFLPTATSCNTRPQVLEFLNNPATPDVQQGSFAKTYWHLFTTCPWAEYHHVLYVPPSNRQTLYINMEELKEALHTMFNRDSTLELDTKK